MTASNEMSKQKFDDLCMELMKQKAVCMKLKSESTDANKKLKKLQGVLAEYMEHFGDKIVKKNEGTIYLKTTRSVSIEDKHAFFEWLKAEGRFDDEASVNATRARVIYEEERAAAIEAGDFEFKVPGLSDEKTYTYAEVRGLKL